MSETISLGLDFLSKYPITPQSKVILGSVELHSEELPREAIIEQTHYRLLRALKQFGASDKKKKPRVNEYIPYGGMMPDAVEFYSFFAAISIVAESKGKFSRIVLADSESNRMRMAFSREKVGDMVSTMSSVFGLSFTLQDDGFICKVEKYLIKGSELEVFQAMAQDDRLRLVNLPLMGGMVYLDRNRLIDLFAMMSRSAILQGIDRVSHGRGKLPQFLVPLSKEIEPYIPKQNLENRKGFQYVERLLQTKINDGRHRTIWMVLGPYLCNVKKMPVEEAISIIQSWVGESGYSQVIRSQTRRAAKIELMPPSVAKLRSEHPDLFEIYKKVGAIS